MTCRRVPRKRTAVFGTPHARATELIDAIDFIGVRGGGDTEILVGLACEEHISVCATDHAPRKQYIPKSTCMWKKRGVQLLYRRATCIPTASKWPPPIAALGNTHPADPPHLSVFIHREFFVEGRGEFCLCGAVSRTFIVKPT